MEDLLLIAVIVLLIGVIDRLEPKKPPGPGEAARKHLARYRKYLAKFKTKGEGNGT